MTDFSENLIEYEINSPEEMLEIGKSMAKLLKPGDIISLVGNLGAGKTVFTQGLCSELGINEPVTSPTFALMNEYNGKLTVYHYDAYRLASDDELFDIGFYDCVPNGISVVEWADNVFDDKLLAKTFFVKIDRHDEISLERRTVTIKAPEGRTLQ